MPSRHFTPDEANATLAEVRPLTARLVDQRAALLAAQARLGEVATHVAGNGGRLEPVRAAALAQAVAAERTIQETVSALHALGVVVKDLDAGLVDFPARREGREVFLCWQLGEARVRFWHGLDEGFAGRKPL